MHAYVCFVCSRVWCVGVCFRACVRVFMLAYVCSRVWTVSACV